MKIARWVCPIGKTNTFSLLTDAKSRSSWWQSVENIAPIRDHRVDVLAEVAKPEKVKYAENKIVLCRTSAKGPASVIGSTATTFDLLCVVVQGFRLRHVYHPSGSVDAERDRRVLNTNSSLPTLS
jgi:hypothetical protein